MLSDGDDDEDDKDDDDEDEDGEDHDDDWLHVLVTVGALLTVNCSSIMQRETC